MASMTWQHHRPSRPAAWGCWRQQGAACGCGGGLQLSRQPARPRHMQVDVDVTCASSTGAANSSRDGWWSQSARPLARPPADATTGTGAAQQDDAGQAQHEQLQRQLEAQMRLDDGERWRIGIACAGTACPAGLGPGGGGPCVAAAPRGRATCGSQTSPSTP
jgi:hypothetical protein